MVKILRSAPEGFENRVSVYDKKNPTLDDYINEVPHLPCQINALKRGRFNEMYYTSFAEAQRDLFNRLGFNVELVPEPIENTKAYFGPIPRSWVRSVGFVPKNEI